MKAEARAIKEALHSCVKKGLLKIQVQTDSHTITKMLTGEWKIPWELIELIEQIQAIMKTLIVEITHIFRKANQN